MRSILPLAACLAVASSPLPPAFAVDADRVVERQALAVSVDAAPRVQAARAEADLAGQQVRQREAQGGWQAFGAVTGATVNEIETADSNRRYDRLQGNIGLTHPLLGSLTAQRSNLLALERARIRAQGNTADVARAVNDELRTAYAQYWTADRHARLAAAWQQQLADRLESLRPQVGNTLRASEFAEARAALRNAREDQQMARNQRQMRLRELQALLGRDIPAFEPRWPVDAGVCRREGVLFEAALASDPISTSARQELALLLERGDSGLTDEVQSNLILTHTQTVEEWDERGDETSIGLTAEIPLRLGQARDARRDLRNAEVLRVQRRLEAARQALRGRIGVAVGDLRNTARARRAADERVAQARADWHEAQRRLEAGLIRSPMPALRAGTRWYRLAAERLDREAEWLRARAPLEGLETPGCRGPRPDALNEPREEMPAS